MLLIVVETNYWIDILFEGIRFSVLLKYFANKTLTFMKESDIMITYFVIGIIVQIVILIERYCRLDVVRALWKDKDIYVWTLLLSVINIVAWPIAIIAEIRNIIIETKGSGS